MVDKTQHCTLPLFTFLLLVLPAAGRAEGGGETPAATDRTKIMYRENVVYGQVHGAGLLADVAFAKSDDPLPAILSVHGGRWRGGHKRDTSAIKVKQWARFGFYRDVD